MNHIVNLQADSNGRSGRRLHCFRAWRRGVRMTKLFICFLAVVLSLLAGTLGTMAQGDVALDYQVKAAYLLNFPKYIDWPAGAFAETNSPIIVDVFGDADVANEFAAMIEGGKAVDGHPIVLKRITKVEEITNDCQILFVAASEKPLVSAILQKVKSFDILTVGESDDFLSNGGIINLVHRNRKIRLQVNLDAAERAHLKISSRLLVVSEVMKDKPN